jgi:sugar/nucleoside kinase (ribokinase family)
VPTARRCPPPCRCAEALAHLRYISPNANELVAIAGRLRQLRGQPALPAPRQEARSAAQALQLLQPHRQGALQAGVRRVVLTLGDQGAAILRLQGGSIRALLLPAMPARVVSVSGAGDTLVAGMIAALLRGAGEELALAVGVAAGRRAVESAANVPQGLQYAELLVEARQHLARGSELTLPCARL